MPAFGLKILIDSDLERKRLIWHQRRGMSDHMQPNQDPLAREPPPDIIYLRAAENGNNIRAPGGSVLWLFPAPNVTISQLGRSDLG